MFEAAIFAKHGVFSYEPIVYWGRAQRSRRREFLIWEAYSKAPRIIFSDLRVCVSERCPATVARDVHAPNIRAGIALDHPVRKREAHAAALTKACHHAASDPEV